MQDLHREITAQGYRGSYSALRDYLAPLRATGQAPPPGPVVPKVRQITSWLLRRPADLDDDEQLQVKQIPATCPHLDVTASHVAGFPDMLTTRTGRHQHLTTWMTRVEGDDPCHTAPGRLKAQSTASK